jgi:hypothetical protein
MHIIGRGFKARIISVSSGLAGGTIGAIVEGPPVRAPRRRA